MVVDTLMSIPTKPTIPTKGSNLFKNTISLEKTKSELLSRFHLSYRKNLYKRDNINY